LDFFLFMYDIQHCFICRLSDSTMAEDFGIEPRTVATTALAVRRTNHTDSQSARNTDMMTYLRHTSGDQDRATLIAQLINKHQEQKEAFLKVRSKRDRSVRLFFGIHPLYHNKKD
jgi:hypothetical protein